MKLEDLNEVLNLFDQICGAGNENCVFFAQADQANISEHGTVMKAVAERLVNEFTGGIGGLVGELVHKAVNSNKSIEDICKELDLEALNAHTQFLINETENSIAIIPILFNGKLHWKTEGAQVFPESGRVIPKILIEKINITKFSFLTPTIRGVRIKLVDGYKLGFMAITNVKTVPYHIKNFRRFNEKYRRK